MSMSYSSICTNTLHRYSYAYIHPYYIKASCMLHMYGIYSTKALVSIVEHSSVSTIQRCTKSNFERPALGQRRIVPQTPLF